MRVALSATPGILSAVALLLVKETVFFMFECRQASERQELTHKSTCSIVLCLELEVADLDCEFSLWFVFHLEVSLEREAALPVSSPSASPSAPVSNIDGH